MSKLRDEFISATRERQVRYAANTIEEMAEAGKSDRKIREYLEKIGGEADIIGEAFDLARDEGLEPEGERARALARDLLGTGTPDQKSIRRVLSKLAYQGFEEEIIYEIADSLME